MNQDEKNYFLQHGVTCEEDITGLLESGVGPKETFTISADFLWGKRGSPEIVLSVFSSLRDCDFPSAEIKEWVDAVYEPSIIDDIVEWHPADWILLGINPADYREEWLKNHGWEYIFSRSLRSLPKSVGIDAFVDYFKIAEMCDLNNLDSFKELLDELTAAGASMVHFTEKFLREIGYRTAYSKHLIELHQRCDEDDPVIDDEKLFVIYNDSVTNPFEADETEADEA